MERNFKNSILSRYEALSRLPGVQLDLLERLVELSEDGRQLPKYIAPDSELGELITRCLLSVVGFPDGMTIKSGSDCKADYFLAICQAWVADPKAVFVALSVCITRMEFASGLDLSVLQEQFGYLRHLDLYSQPQAPGQEKVMNIPVSNKRGRNVS